MKKITVLKPLTTRRQLLLSGLALALLTQKKRRQSSPRPLPSRVPQPAPVQSALS